jgi:CDGSH-type Zn-finger protein
VVTDSGEYQVHGDVLLMTMSGEILVEEYRLTLCRCGESNNKPFCDNTHRKARFVAPSQVADNRDETTDLQPTGTLRIVTTANGPLLLQGNFEIQDIYGQHVYRGANATLCRCGGSANKPFCDDSHRENDFSTE